MAKIYGTIGYAETVEERPGVFVKQITERHYQGDLYDVYSQRQSSDKVNDDINLSNRVSIIADPFAYQNFQSMVYFDFKHGLGGKWKITKVDVQYPRLVLTIGGVYNE